MSAEITDTVIENFIVIEGIDGAGKSTQCSLVHKMLIDDGLAVYETREPHSGIIGAFTRDILNNHIHTLTSTSDETFQSNILAYLFAADRYEHIYANNGILDCSRNYDLVLCDRYLFSSLAYQGESYQGGASQGEVPQNKQSPPRIPTLTETLNARFPLPSLLIYLDIKPLDTMKRMKEKKKDGLETLENLKSVHKRYAEVIATYKQHTPHMNIVSIDASLDQACVTQEIYTCIKQHYHRL